MIKLLAGLTYIKSTYEYNVWNFPNSHYLYVNTSGYFKYD